MKNKQAERSKKTSYGETNENYLKASFTKVHCRIIEILHVQDLHKHTHARTHAHPHTHMHTYTHTHIHTRTHSLTHSHMHQPARRGGGLL